MRREIAPSRIACTAFSQAKWYINTPEKSNKTLPGDERRENRSFFHMTNLWTTITKTTITRVDSYMRHENPLGRFLREATGTEDELAKGNPGPPSFGRFDHSAALGWSDDTRGARLRRPTVDAASATERSIPGIDSLLPGPPRFCYRS